MRTLLKNCLLIFFVIGIIIVLYVCTEKTLYRRTEEIKLKSESLIEHIQSAEYDEARSEGKEIKKQWEEYSGKIFLYIDHTEIENINTSIDTMNIYMKNEEYVDAMAEASRIISKTQYLYKKEILTPGNII